MEIIFILFVGILVSSLVIHMVVMSFAGLSKLMVELSGQEVTAESAGTAGIILFMVIVSIAFILFCIW